MMERYFLHLRDGREVVIDEEGGEFASNEDLRRAMIATARDIIAGDVVRGVINLDLTIVAQTGSGELVDQLRFRDAVVLESGWPAGDDRVRPRRSNPSLCTPQNSRQPKLPWLGRKLKAWK